jgi:SAM-dependent methyltransferase
MVEDYWPTLHSDPFARERLKRSCELLNCAYHHSVLDVGCHKEEAREFLPKGVDYTGIDALKGDEFDGGVNLLYKFNRILCLEVLEHLKYPQKTLASIAGLLKDDGICVISLPNEASLFHRVRCLFGLVDAECFSENGKHLHLPSLKQARSLVERYFRVVRLEYYISDGCCSRSNFARKLLKVVPKLLLKLLSQLVPSLFSRGFIFVCVKRS